MPLVSPIAWSRTTVRFVVALCAFALLATVMVGATQPVGAADVGGQISLNRSGQLYAESVMRAQDQLIVKLKAQHKSTKKAVKKSKRTLKRNSVVLAKAKGILQERRERLARVSGLHEHAADAPVPEDYLARLKGIRGEVRVAERRVKNFGGRVRSNYRAVKSGKARLKSLAAQRRLAVSRREGAEASLAGRIVQMTKLAAIRAESESTVTLTGSGSFSWPTTGRISQTYGCTGFRYNPRRGSCRHFHDGLDIVDGHGTPVRAVAVGVVAYVGWNPWDESGRAYIVVVVHPDGYVSRYGHLTATRRVRAGEVVHTGQIIGKMGNTGRSTGTHLHFELLKGGKDVNPLSYLPSGVVKIKVDKTTTRQGAAEKARAEKAKARKKAKVQKARARRQAKQAARLAAKEAAAAAKACAAAAANEADEGIYDLMTADDADDALDCPVTPVPAAVPETAADPAGDKPGAKAGAKPGAKPAAKSGAKSAANRTRPGVPMAYRGTSPVPA